MKPMECGQNGTKCNVYIIKYMSFKKLVKDEITE